MTHEEFLQSLAGRFHGVRNQDALRLPLLACANPSEAVARWLAWHVAMYFQSCSQAVFERCTAWKYWQRDEKEDVDWTIYHGYCQTHQHHSERTQLKTLVLGVGDIARNYTCEIHDWTTHAIQRVNGHLRGGLSTVMMWDVSHTRPQPMGRVRWTSLDRPSGPPNLSVAQRTRTIDSPRFGAPQPRIQWQADGAPIYPASERTSGQDRGSAVAAAVRTGSEWANTASLDHRIETELNALLPEVYRLAPRPGEGVLAVVESETQSYGAGMQGAGFLSCYLYGLFPSSDEALQSFRPSRGLSTAPHQGATSQRKFYWGEIVAG